MMTRPKINFIAHLKARLAIMLSIVSLASSCGMKSEVEVASSCGKPTDPACRKAVVKTDFNDVTTLTMRVPRPTISWPPEEKASKIAAEYLVRTSAEQPSRQELGTSDTRYTSSTSLTDGAYEFYIWKRTQGRGSWAAFKHYRLIIDSTPPKITSVSAMTSNGTYAQGATIDLQINFSEAVTLNGNAAISLSSGGTASYVSGSGTSSLAFRYIIGGSDGSSSFLDVLDKNAMNITKSITDTAGNAANLTLPKGSDSGALPMSSQIMVGGSAAPGAPQISVATSSFNAAFSTNISQNATADINFKEFRYTTTGTDPTCSTGTASTAQPTTVNIPAATTTLKAITCDLAGNGSAVTTATYTYDNTPPTAPTVTSASGYSASTSVTWTWTAGTGGNGNFRYRLDNPDLTTGTTATTSTSAPLTGLTDGTRMLYVQERDAAGNWSTSGSFAVTVDATAPGAPQISVADSTFSSAFATNISQNATTDINFKEFRYTTTGTDPTCSTGTASTTQPTAVNIPAATTTLKAVSCDLSGNISAVTTRIYTYDNTVPNAPVVTSGAAYSASNSVTWTWTSGGGGNGNYRYRLNNSDLSTGTTATATTSVTLSSLSQGANTLYVQERNAAGTWSSSGSYAVTVDTTAPGAPQISVADTAFNAAFNTNISQNATTDANFKEFRYITTGTDPTCSTGTASTAQPTTVNTPAVTTTLKAITCDLAGNGSAVTTATYTYDNAPPTAPTVTSASGYSASTSVTWTWTAGTGGNGNFRYKLNSTDLTTGATTTATTTASLTSLAEGTNTLYVQERDDAGNWSISGSFAVTVDTTAPEAPQISVSEGSFSAAFTTNISQNSTADANFKEFRYTTTGTDPTCSTGTASTTQPTAVNIPAATTTLKAVSCDLSGNISEITTRVYTYDNTVPNAPVVTSAAAYSASTSVTWTWTSGGGGNGNYRYRLNNSDLSTGTTATATTSVTLSSLSQGANTLYVQERNAAGTWSSSGSYAVTVDTTAPGFPQISVAATAFNAAFNTNISQNATTDANFKEFRYTTTGTDPTCSTGTVSTTQPTVVNIPASNTTLKAITCDLAGNGSVVTTATYTYDNTPPTAPTVTSASGYSASTSVTWTWTAGTGGNGNFRYRLDNPDLTTGTTATTSTSATLTGLTDGTRMLYVQERDAAGNWSTSGSYAVTVDATAPGAPQISVADSTFSSAFATNISQNATTDINFKEFRYTTTGTDPTCSTGTASTTQPTAVNIPAATTTLKAITCDLAGNGSAVTTATYTYDNTPPNAPSVTSTSAYSSSTSVTWTWTSGGGLGNGNYRYKLNSTDLTTGATTTATTTASLTSLTEGTNTLYVQERDAAGNWSTSGSYAVIVDTTAPGAPQISVATSFINAAFNTNISQNATTDANFKEFRYTTTGTDPTCSTGTASTAQPTTVNIPAATTTLKAITCDLAGNSSVVTTATYTYDNTPPTAPTVTSASGYSASTSVTWTWTAGTGGNGNFRYKLNSTDLTTGATTTATTTASLTSLTEGTNTLYVQERDVAGNWSTSGSYAVIVDTTVPGAPQISVATSFFNAAFNTNISQNATTDANFKEFRYTTTGTDPTCSTGTASTAQPTTVNIPASNTTLKVITCDLAGNSSTITSATYTYDNTPPSAPIVTSSSAYSASTSVTWTWASGGGGNGNYRYRLDNADLSTGTTATATTTATINSLTQGSHTLYVQERDGAGNWSLSGSYAVFVDTTAPGAPQISVTDSSFNTVFTTNISQNATTDVNFKEFRYTTTGVNPTCSTGTSSTMQPTVVNISTVTTTLKSVTCDLAGNISAITTRVYTFDNTPPNSPSVTSASSTSSSSTVTWSWTSGGGMGNGNYRYKLDSADLSTGATTTATTSVTLSSLSNGARTLYVQERDTVGNWSAAGTYTVTVSVSSGVTLSNIRTGGTWVYLKWTGGTSPYQARLYSDALCATEVRSLVGTSATETIFGGLTQSTSYYHRLFDNASGSTTCTSFTSGITGTANVNLTSTGSTSSTIGLTFNETINGGHTQFLVWQFTGNNCQTGAAVKMATVAAISNAGSASISGLSANTAYSYRVFADTMTAGDYSSCVNAATTGYADGIYPFDTHIVVKVKTTGGPFKVSAHNGSSCGTQIYSTGDTSPVYAGNFVRVTALTANTSYSIKVTEFYNATNYSCHPVQTLASSNEHIMLTVTTGMTLDFTWSAGGGGAYQLIQFAADSMNPCRGIGDPIYNHATSLSYSLSEVPADGHFMVLGASGGTAGFVKHSTCYQIGGTGLE